MAERRISTKAELIADIEQHWKALNAILERLDTEQLTVLQDAQGWTVKDHVIHMTRWERSVEFLLQRKPRHEGLGVEETLYLEGNEDEINAAIYQQTRELPLDIVLTEFRETHQDLLTHLDSLTDTNLQRRYRDYLPDEPGEGDGPRAIDLIYGNTAHHFAEHLRWIQSLIEEPGEEK